MPDYDGLLLQDHNNRRRRNKYRVRSKLKYSKNRDWTVLLAISPYDIDIINKLNAGKHFSFLVYVLLK